MNNHRGHCRCGGVVVSVQDTPELSVYCHCDDCRRSAGAPVIAAVGFLKSGIEWVNRETLSSYTNGTATRLFCNRCGSPVAQEHESADDTTFFNTAFMDEPDKFPPTYHTFAGRQVNWLELADELPRHEKTIRIEVAE